MLIDIDYLIAIAKNNLEDAHLDGLGSSPEFKKRIHHTIRFLKNQKARIEIAEWEKRHDIGFPGTTK